MKGFLAYALTNLPPSELQDATFRLEGERLSISEVGVLYGTLKSVPVDRVDRFPEDVPKAAIMEYLAMPFNAGKGVSSYDVVQGMDLGLDSLSNALWEGHRWRTVKDVFGA